MPRPPRAALAPRTALASRTALALALLAPLLGGCLQRPAAPELFATSLNEPYALASGDRLRVIVFGQDSLSNVHVVDGAGRISVPLIGEVDCRGRTTQALERQVEARLRNGFLREPRVSIEVEGYRPFFILGEVTTSGQFAYVNGMTAQTAVAIAGGFGPRASRESVEVTRVVRGETVTGTLPVTAPIRPGDTVVVRERFF